MIAGARILRIAAPLALLAALTGAAFAGRAPAFSRVAMLVAAAAALACWVAAAAEARRLHALERLSARLADGEAGVRTRETAADAIGRIARALERIGDDRRARLAALQGERDEQERMIAHLNDGVALVDGGGALVRGNARLAALLGVPHPPDPGAAFTAFARSPAFDELLEDARAGIAAEAEVRLWTPEPRLVHARAVPIGSARGGAVLLVVRDLSESEALARIRQDFVANVSHDLRTPLTSLRGYAETLLEGGLEDVEHREGFVRVIRDSAVRLEALVEDLLSLAELERPGARPRLETFDLRAAVERQAAAYRPAAGHAGITLTLEPGAAVPVAADRPRIEQAIANLLDNAVKYTERGGVRVTLGAEAGWAWCEVADSGEGIPGEHLPRIFERFYRVDPARSRGKGGTGLGLSIVKHVIALHGGDVSVESAPGKGSRFRFRIPVAPAA